MKIIDWRVLFLIVVFLSQLSSCAVTTRATEGTTETFGNTTEASSKFTSSTSPSSDDQAKAEALITYARANYSRIRADIAMGQGEYLETLAILMEIKNEQKDQFYALTKQQFTELFPAPNTTTEEFLKQLNLISSQLT